MTWRQKIPRCNKKRMIWTRRWSRNNKEELQRLEKDQEAIRKNDMETKNIKMQ